MRTRQACSCTPGPSARKTVSWQPISAMAMAKMRVMKRVPWRKCGAISKRDWTAFSVMIRAWDASPPDKHFVTNSFTGRGRRRRPYYAFLELLKLEFEIRHISRTPLLCNATTDHSWRAYVHFYQHLQQRRQLFQQPGPRHARLPGRPARFQAVQRTGTEGSHRHDHRPYRRT